MNESVCKKLRVFSEAGNEWESPPIWVDCVGGPVNDEDPSPVDLVKCVGFNRRVTVAAMQMEHIIVDEVRFLFLLFLVLFFSDNIDFFRVFQIFLYWNKCQKISLLFWKLKI